MANEEKVYEFMKKVGEPLKQKDIAEETGLSTCSVGKAIKVLKEEGKIESPKRCFYQAK